MSRLSREVRTGDSGLFECGMAAICRWNEVLVG